MDRDQFDEWAEERRRRRAERDSRRAESREKYHHGEGRPHGRGPRKERVLHTRISEQLDESLRSAADELRVPVSNLVRNVLEDVFDVVESVTDNVGDLVEDLVDEADSVRERLSGRRGHRQRRRRRSSEPPRSDPDWQAAEREVSEMVDDETVNDQPEPDRPEFADVLGWQPLVLNGQQRCSDCGRDMTRGDKGFLGLSTAQDSQTYLCPECVRSR
jgi:hypothetical protein